MTLLFPKPNLPLLRSGSFVEQFGDEKVLALSWKQPFGTAMLFGKIETRVWATKYRGWVLICTSKMSYAEPTVRNISGNSLFEKMCVTMRSDAESEEGTLNLNGYAIAIGRLVDCRPMNPLDETTAFVKYHPDLFCHIYEDVRAIEPFAWKGTQGWKEVTNEIKQQIIIL